MQVYHVRAISICMGRNCRVLGAATVIKRAWLSLTSAPSSECAISCQQNAMLASEQTIPASTNASYSVTYTVTLCDPIWHVSSSSGVATSVSELLYPCYLLTYLFCSVNFYEQN